MKGNNNNNQVWMWFVYTFWLGSLSLIFFLLSDSFFGHDLYVNGDRQRHRRRHRLNFCCCVPEARTTELNLNQLTFWWVLYGQTQIQFIHTYIRHIDNRYSIVFERHSDQTELKINLSTKIHFLSYHKLVLFVYLVIFVCLFLSSSFSTFLRQNIKREPKAYIHFFYEC